MRSDGQLLGELARAVEGLLFMSESDHPFQAMRWEATAAVTPQFLRDLTGRGAETPVMAQDVDYFFRNAVSEQEWKNADAIAVARRYQELIRQLKEGLTDVKVYRVGATDVMVYIVGRGPGGDWLGLSTRVVET